MIKAVFFDLDNTLFSYERGHHNGMIAVCDYVEQKMGIPEYEVFRCYEETYREIHERLGFHNADIHNRTLRFSRMVEKWGQPPLPHALQMCRLYYEQMLAACTPFPGVEAFVRYAKAKGLKVGIGTDMTSYIQYEKLERLGISSCVDVIVTSEEAAVEKPHPDFFSRCLQKAGVEAGECVFVGDGLEKDVLGANQNGLVGVWYWPGAALTSANDFWPDPAKKPASLPEGVRWGIGHYADLPALIRRIDEEK